MQNVLFKRSIPDEESLSVMLGKYIPITSVIDKPVSNKPERNGLSTFSVYDYDYSYKSGKLEKRLRADIFSVKKIFLRLKKFFKH